MAMFGRLVHYGVDLLFVSTVLAGIKKTTGFAPDTAQIPESSIRTFTDSYLKAGETVFSVATGQAVQSSYFKKVE